jgi:DNA-binding SARP family transcriptional activator
MAGTLRVYLAGTIRLERDDVLVTEERLPGRQGRVAFAMLAAEHDRALSKDLIADELWAGGPPPAWEVALRSVVSKIRTAIADVGLDGDALAHAFGCYQLHLPPDAWVDLEAAADAVHRAETAVRDGQLEDAMGWSLAANAIARRGFLPGEDGGWASLRRADLRDVHVRALECRGRTLLEREQHEAAARDAERVVALEPFRESAYRLLMRAQAAAGNRGQALRAYERCRTTLSEELGAEPSSETEAVYLEILRTA